MSLQKPTLIATVYLIEGFELVLDHNLSPGFM